MIKTKNGKLVLLSKCAACSSKKSLLSDLGKDYWIIE